ncbi:hypothetical protein [Naumannella halotolerans]|uniref:DUF5666 domain-containing protein n=1 Tax=Naumannella halotolerans TaxID=993414 RepID=A0A4V3ENJ7_9ACTN|nr:hypothetical protein [Naumannella halotolerans]TDT34018.1 hypothetical protein CLV29_1662 [Naumannella halotolerans]
MITHGQGSSPSGTSGLSRVVLCATVVGALTLGLTACGSEDGASSAEATGSTAAPAPAAGGGGRNPGSSGPGVSGLVAAVDGDTAQVQGNEAQTAVSWDDDTSFSAEESAELAEVTVGVCVTVIGESVDGTVSATSVGITGDEGCSEAEQAPGGGQPPSGAPAEGEAPAGMPSARPDAMPSGWRRRDGRWDHPR